MKLWVSDEDELLKEVKQKCNTVPDYESEKLEETLTGKERR